MQHFFEITSEVFLVQQSTVTAAALLLILRFLSNLELDLVYVEENAPVNQSEKIISRKNNQNRMLDLFQFSKIPKNDSMWVVCKNFENSPNLTVTSLSVNRLKNSYAQTDYENMNFELADQEWRHTQVRTVC